MRKKLSNVLTRPSIIFWTQVWNMSFEQQSSQTMQEKKRYKRLLATWARRGQKIMSSNSSIPALLLMLRQNLWSLTLKIHSNTCFRSVKKLSRQTYGFPKAFDLGFKDSHLKIVA